MNKLMAAIFIYVLTSLFSGCGADSNAQTVGSEETSAQTAALKCNATPSSSGVPIKLTIDASTSITHTTGGFTGAGIGSYFISGTFDMLVTGTEISFINIDVDQTPGNSHGSFIPEYLMSYDGVAFFSPELDDNNIPVNVIGTFDGYTLRMSGSVPGNITNNFIINAHTEAFECSTSEVSIEYEDFSGIQTDVLYQKIEVINDAEAYNKFWLSIPSMSNEIPIFDEDSDTLISIILNAEPCLFQPKVKDVTEKGATIIVKIFNEEIGLSTCSPITTPFYTYNIIRVSKSTKPISVLIEGNFSNI